MTIEGEADEAVRRSNRRVVTRAVVALGFNQIICWGSTLYALGVLGQSIAASTGWGVAVVYGGLTTGLLTGAVFSRSCGRMIDEHGGRLVMSVGAVVAALGLAGVALSQSIASYLAAWVVVGIAMRMTLYDAAFAAIVQVTPSRGRVAISYLTLFGGLASSVFWPIGHALDLAYGWRATLLIFAAINLLVSLPLAWFGLAAREESAASESDSKQSDTNAEQSFLVGPARLMAMIMFSVVMSASAFIYGAMAAHLPAVVESAGVSAAVAVSLSSVKGVVQTLSRAVDLVFGRHLHPIVLGRITISFLPLSFAVCLWAGSGLMTAIAFAVLFGVANGLTTIVRGAVPLVLFGAKGYGEVLGILATPYLVLNAVAPLVMAMMMAAWGMTAATYVMLTAGALAAVAMEVMAAWFRRVEARRVGAKGQS